MTSSDGSCRDLYPTLRNAHQLTFLASFKYIVGNYSILIEKLNMLESENKRTLKPFVLSFYNERLKPFINSILGTPATHPGDDVLVKNIEVYKKLLEQITALEAF